MIFNQLWKKKTESTSPVTKMSAIEMQTFEKYCQTFKADEVLTQVKAKNLSYVEAQTLLLDESSKELSALAANFPGLFNTSQGNDTSLSIASGNNEPMTIHAALDTMMKTGISAEEAEIKVKQMYPKLFENPYKTKE